tara:strand:+ start:379 stop:597 length:219 start_codon:yes stop_codon:yes gene_type:complete
MSKAEVQALVQASIDAANAVKVAVDALDIPDVAELQKKIEEQAAEIASLKALLKGVDAAAKAIDAAIPDDVA